MNLKLKKISTVLLFTAILIFAFCATCLAATNAGNQMTAHYTFDNDLKDSSGNGNDGTATGNVTFSDDAVFGKSAVLNDGFIKIPNNSFLNLGKNFSISVWVLIDHSEAEQGNNDTILSRLTSDQSYNSYCLYVHDAGIARLEFDNDNLDGTVLETNSNDFTNTWTNIIYTSDGKNIFAYINGKLDETGKLDGTKYVKSDQELIIGADATGGGSFKGKMDDLRIYNYALSQNEIDTINKVNAFSNKIELTVDEGTMLVDGNQVPIDPINEYVRPVVDSDSGRTTVPIRSIIENMGGTVNWNPADSTMNIILKSTSIKLQLDNKNANVNGKNLLMDIPAKSIEGRTMIPLRFVVENLGAKVLWDGSTQKITLLYNK